MPRFYFNTDIRTQFSAPQFTRLRHRWRGVRESWKINLEIQQMVFSVHSLYKRYDSIKSQHTAYTELLFNGGSVDGVKSFSNLPITLDGLNDMINQVAELQARVQRLEQ